MATLDGSSCILRRRRIAIGCRTNGLKRTQRTSENEAETLSAKIFYKTRHLTSRSRPDFNHFTYTNSLAQVACLVVVLDSELKFDTHITILSGRCGSFAQFDVQLQLMLLRH